MYQFPKRLLLTLLLFWLIAVIMQLPNLNRPLSKHHEFNMAMILNVVKSWKIAGGASQYNYTPIINYNNSGDKYFGEDSLIVNGKYYYPSFGPMQFILPYTFANLFSLKYTPLFIQLLGLVILFFVYLLVYNCIVILFNENINKHKISLFCSILFLFFPGTLWYYTNGFVHESLASLFYLYIFYILFLAFINPVAINSIKVFLLTLAVFFGVLTDWYVILVASFTCLVLLFYFLKLKNKIILSLFISIFISSILSFLLLFYLYSSEMSQENLINNLLYKYLVRSSDSLFSYSSIKSIVFHFISLFGFALIFILLIVFFKMKISKIIFFLLLTPPVIYMLIFSNYSIQHEYSILKFTLPLLYLIGSVINYLLFIKKLNFYIFLICTSNVMFYFFINKPSIYKNYYRLYSYEKVIGSTIAKKINLEDFIVSDLIEKNNLAIMYYAERNIRFVKNENEAIEYKTKNNLNSIQFVTIIKDSIVIKKIF